MKIAIVHDHLKVYGGAERVLEVMHEMYPDAPVYTTVYMPQNLPETFKSWDIRPSWLQKMPFIGKLTKIYIPFYPLAFESFNLQEHDIVISSTAHFAKGIITKPGTVHVCYMYNIPRFLYGYPTEMNRKKFWPLKLIYQTIENYLRIWDFAASVRPDEIIVDSREVAERVAKFYRRAATVIYPPANLKMVDQNMLRPTENPYYLIVSRLERYKNIEMAIEACARLNLSLKIIGTGKMRQIYGKLAERNPLIEFLGFVDDQTLAQYYTHCEALIFPQEEDFGLTPVECMYYGRPVIALKKGGALETIKEGVTGEFFSEDSVQSLITMLKNFDPRKYNPKDCKEQAQKFSKVEFKKQLSEFIDKTWESHHA